MICCGRQRFSENKEWTLAESIGGCRGKAEPVFGEKRPECRKTVEFPTGKESSEGFLHGKIKEKKGIL